MNQHYLLIALAALVLALLAVVLLLRGRRQTVRLSDAAPAAYAPPPAAKPTLDDPLLRDGGDMTAGVDLPPAEAQAPVGAGDPLTTIKGLGPKAAARLQALGITRYDQIAGWDEARAAAIDAQMGPFSGRIARDRWIEQARLLAAGDRAGFEAAFGRIGGA